MPELPAEMIREVSKAIETELDRMALLEHGADGEVVEWVVDSAARMALQAAGVPELLAENERLKGAIRHAVESARPSHKAGQPMISGVAMDALRACFLSEPNQ